MKLDSYTVTDFVMDEEFQQWVRHPDVKSNVFWENWIAQHPEKADTIKKARFILLSIHFKQVPHEIINHTSMWQKIQEGVSRNPVQVASQANQHSLMGTIFHYWKRWAAVLVVTIMGSLIIYFVLLSTQTVTYTTTYGEQRAIQLPDNSVITLNANSTMKFDSPWTDGKTREVWLEGEAFFNVVKLSSTGKNIPSPGSEFIVHSGDLSIEVLGTKFNVNNRRGKTRVVLNSGKVTLHHSQIQGVPTLVMNPAELAEYSQAGHTLVKKKVNPEQYSAWLNKRLIFNETPLLEIAHILEDNYGWKVTFANVKLADRKFTGAASTDHIDLLLTAISESFHLKIIKRDNQIRIESKS